MTFLIRGLPRNFTHLFDLSLTPIWRAQRVRRTIDANILLAESIFN